MKTEKRQKYLIMCVCFISLFYKNTECWGRYLYISVYSKYSRGIIIFYFFIIHYFLSLFIIFIIIIFLSYFSNKFPWNISFAVIQALLRVLTLWIIIFLYNYNFNKFNYFFLSNFEFFFFFREPKKYIF